MNTLNYDFSAFVSYRHLDSTEPGQQWAGWVQTLLERYTTPPELAGQRSLYGDPVPATMPRVFRDKDQLPAHGDLGALIHEALDRSRVLIVLCTPGAVTSPWVADEILHFKKLGRADRIIAIVLRGKPHSIDPAEECYPEPLRFKMLPDTTLNREEKEHPIYIDLRPPLGTQGATTPEEYRALLNAADLYKDGAIEQAVVKYASSLDDARILLLSGALGLAPRDLTQRDLLRRIEEEKQRATESASQAKWEAEQREIAENARDVAEKSRNEADMQRRRARGHKQIALFLLVVVLIFLLNSFFGGSHGRSAMKELAQSNATAANVISLQFKLCLGLAMMLGMGVIAFGFALKYYQQKRRHQNMTLAKSQAAHARNAAEDLVSDLRQVLESCGTPERIEAMHERLEQHRKKHPPEITYEDEAACAKALQFVENGDTHLERGNNEQARDNYAQAIQILERLTAKEVENAEWHRALARIYLKMGALLHQAGERSHALENYRNCVKIRRRFAQDNPFDAEWQLDLATAYRRLGKVEELGDIKAALATYQKGSEVMMADATHAKWALELADLKFCIARLLSEAPKQNKRKIEWLVNDGLLRLDEVEGEFLPRESERTRDDLLHLKATFLQPPNRASVRRRRLNL